MSFRSSFSSFFRLSPLAFALVALSSLSFETGCARPAACERNSDCTNAYCSAGECKRDCIDAERDCADGFICNLNAQCVPLYEGGQGGGRVDAGAGDGGGGGGAGGQGGSDAPGETGGGGSGDEADGGPPDAEPGDDGDAGDDAGPDDALDGGEDGSVRDAGGDASDGEIGDDGGSGGDDGGGIVGRLGKLDLCGQDGDCEDGLLCRPMYVGGPKRCTVSCTSSASCMMGTRCETVGGERYCAQTDIGKECSGDAQCNARCMVQRGYCTSSCVTGGDCPNGYGCTAVGTPPARMCVKTSVYCGDNPSICAGGANACEHDDIPISGCTIPCSTQSDCPQRASALGSAWTCLKKPSWTTGYCMRPADVYGPQAAGERTEYLCAPGTSVVVNACGDGLNTDVDAWHTPSPPPVSCSSNFTAIGVPGDTCVDSCLYRGGCAFGFGCSAVTAIGSERLALCLPTGDGEIGEACDKHRDCAFGYCDLATNRCSRDCSADGVCPSGASCVETGALIEGVAFRRCEAL